MASFFEKILGPVFGTKPSVPELAELNLSEEQLKAIEANLAAAPEARRLSDLTADQIDDLLKRTFPNLDAIRGLASRNIESLMEGEIPQDVLQKIRRAGASEAAEGGYLGMGMHMFKDLRNYGLVGMDVMAKGMNLAQNWMQASAALYEPAISTYRSMFITPMQQASFSVEERNAQFQRSWMKNQIKAMPDPIVRGIHDTIMSLAAAYLGGSYNPGASQQQNYAAAGGAGLGGLSGDGGPRYGPESYQPGGWNEYQGDDWSDPGRYQGFDWSDPANFGSPGVGGAESVPGGVGIGGGGGVGDFGGGFGGGFGGYV